MTEGLDIVHETSRIYMETEIALRVACITLWLDKKGKACAKPIKLYQGLSSWKGFAETIHLKNPMTATL